MKVAILLIFGLSSLINAEMVFKTKLVEITAKPDVTEITVEFPFEIMGSAAEIIEYEAPCTCLTARVEPLNPDRSTKLRWDIGENGRIFGRFKMG
ncbi:hypothetical protein N9Z85_07600, partial [Akkermansiaceae bacterium]|nr:hypothetical protein [Akkermansiaceae bacterium]